MKHNCLFRPAILTGMVVANCLSANGYVESNTLRGELTTPVTISENGSLVTRLTPVWERQLSNDDANQNQMSMAVANGNIYVCVDYYDADTDETTNRKGKIYIRKYACATGAETTHLIDYPSFSGIADAHAIASDDPNMPFIVSDDTDALFVAQVCHPTAHHFDVHFAEINQSTMTINEDKQYLAEGLLQLIEKMWMERIDRIHGSIKDNNFEFRAVFGGVYHTSNDKYNYSYYIMNYQGQSEVPVGINIVNHNTSSAIAYPQLSNIPGSSSYIFTSMPNGTANAIPELYTSSDGEPIKLGFTQAEFCRGINLFVHNDQLHAVYAKTNNSTDGSQFQLIELDASTGVHVDVAKFPDVPFSVKSPLYKAVQQMAVAKPVAVKNRADAGIVATDLYVYAPGAGVGAYRIETKEDTSNGIVSVADADVQVKWINGQLQFGSSDFDGQSVKIYSATGQLVLTAEICNGIADLNGLSAGFYVAVTPAGTYKICR